MLTNRFAQAMLSEYTHFHFANNGDLLAALVKTKLAQNATNSTIVPRLKEEIDVLVAEEFPECRDWTTFKIQPFTLRAVTRMAGRIFVGPEINRREDWVETNINFVVHVFMTVAKLQFMPQFLRPIGQYLVPDVRRTAADLEKAGNLLKPIIDQRMRDKENFPGYEAPADMISWLLETLSDKDRADIAVHAQLQLMLAMASGHGTNNIIVDCIFDLADDPDLQDELREEVEAAYATGAPGSDWTKEKLLMLKKMDSLMKEVQRFRGNLSKFSLSENEQNGMEKKKKKNTNRLTTNSRLPPQSPEAHIPLRRHLPPSRNKAARPTGGHLPRRGLLPVPRPL